MEEEVVVVVVVVLASISISTQFSLFSAMSNCARFCNRSSSPSGEVVYPLQSLLSGYSLLLPLTLLLLLIIPRRVLVIEEDDFPISPSLLYSRLVPANAIVDNINNASMLFSLLLLEICSIEW